jgi:hypothetical protein
VPQFLFSFPLNVSLLSLEASHSIPLFFIYGFSLNPSHRSRMATRGTYLSIKFVDLVLWGPTQSPSSLFHGLSILGHQFDLMVWV